KRGGPVNPVQVNVQFNVPPSALRSAVNVPLAPVPFGGTSLNVESLAEKWRGWSSSSSPRAIDPATLATASPKDTVTVAILNAAFFIALLQKEFASLRICFQISRPGDKLDGIRLILSCPAKPRIADKPPHLYETCSVVDSRAGCSSANAL